jgi:chorismate mutase
VQPGLNIEPIESWLGNIVAPLVIAGPCSAESEEQITRTAQFLSGFPQVKIFRSGIWKPRTRPGEFEGLGSTALKWLQKVKPATGLMTCVEVAAPEHILDCLDHGIDILWIGSRTVVNPFSVKEISRALEGTGVPVMVKNPMHPDIELWSGALERLNMAGINKLVAIHRGFSSWHSKPFRNTPGWEVPIELKRRHPGLPVIVDPSHISGDAAKVPNISQMTLDMGFAGLMVEVHPDPQKALSDSNQQLDFESFGRMLKTLVVRKPSENSDWEEEITLLRHQIDQLDSSLIHILAQRFGIVSHIGEIKRRENVPSLQMERWQRILKERLAEAERQGLSPRFIKKILEQIHKEAIRLQGEK